MIRNRKLTLEQRIARLESVVKSVRNIRKFESFDTSDCEVAYDLIADVCEQHNAESYFDGFNKYTGEYELSIADVLDDQDYADDWETNDESFSIKCEPDDTLTVKLVSSNFADPRVLGSHLHTPKQAAAAIIKYRFGGV